MKVGDYYYHGLGVPDEPESIRWEKAAGYYQSAADTQMSALAMWNLGWMYENGVGVPQVNIVCFGLGRTIADHNERQDFHLAKRHYDLAYETNSEAYLPVLLSLVKLHARSIWHTLMGGKGGLTIWDGDEEATRSYYDQPEIEGGNEQGGGASAPQRVRACYPFVRLHCQRAHGGPGAGAPSRPGRVSRAGRGRRARARGPRGRRGRR